MPGENVHQGNVCKTSGGNYNVYQQGLNRYYSNTRQHHKTIKGSLFTEWKVVCEILKIRVHFEKSKKNKPIFKNKGHFSQVLKVL